MLSTFSKRGRDVWNCVPVEIKQTHSLKTFNFFIQEMFVKITISFIIWTIPPINIIFDTDSFHYVHFFCIVLFIWLCLKVKPLYELIIIVIYTWLSVCDYMIKCIRLIFSLSIFCYVSVHEWINWYIMFCMNVLLNICIFVYY